MQPRQHTAPHPTRSLRPMQPARFSKLDTSSERLSTAAVLPEQFYSSPGDTYKTSGEVALIYAVLDDALRCFQQQAATKRQRAQRLAREAEEWFFTDNPHWPFSFVNICAVLGLDPEYIRLGLKQWRQRGPTKPQKKRRRVMSVRQPLRIKA